MAMVENKPPILHILVVGFHHKLGCQVEFSYPPLIIGTTGKNECPSGWKYLPTLALPDGSHNFTEDTVFFNLPSLFDPSESVYGVSCYRQIPVEKLKIRTADVTRSTVQKSVCILARLPIYGYIEVKLSLIADAFFEKGDFSCTGLLIKAYQQLNACLLDAESCRPLRHFYVGLSVREIMLHWRHKTLVLFKLFLLQRRVICFGSPVRGMCVLILGVSSLIPRLLEKGFQEVACVRTSRPLSPMPDFTDSIQREAAEILQAQEQQQQQIQQTIAIKCPNEMDNKVTPPDMSSCTEAVDTNTLVSTSVASADSFESVESGELLDKRLERSNSLAREASMDALVSTLCALSAINPDEYRAPVSIFASGNLCLPYLSLPYMDLLTDPSVLSYVIGTSNVLFQQKRQLADVLVDIESANIDTNDPELRRQLVLSTEDLRFMDYLMKHVQSPKEDAEGSENWIREQFQGYILALLRVSVATDTTAKDCDHFNSHFIQAFKRTQCFQEWYDVRPSTEFFETIPAGHPFSGTLSVADMKLKIAQTMQNSESGRKINQAVNTTSRAVGGAISQAKGAFSNWWSSITTPPIVQMSTGNIVDNNGAVISHDISVAFQNRNDPNEIEVGVSINLDEGKKDGNNSSTSGGSEKLTDSAEELEEDSNADALKTNKPPSEAEEAATAKLDNLITETSMGQLQHVPKSPRGKEKPQQKQQQGVVEIGKEAEMLDSNDIKELLPQQPQKESQPAPTARGSIQGDNTNGDIFIV